jgi:hypothetical protein
MRTISSLPKQLSGLFTAVLLIVGISCPVFAGIVTTTDLLADRQNQQTRDRLNTLLARKDVQTALTAQGVDIVAARARVASMSDTEIQTLAVNMEKLPAGGKLSKLELVLLILLIIIIV